MCCHACIHRVEVSIAGGSLRQSPRNKHECSCLESSHKCGSSAIHRILRFTSHPRPFQVLFHSTLHNILIGTPADDTVAEFTFLVVVQAHFLHMPCDGVNTRSLKGYILLLFAGPWQVLRPIYVRTSVRGVWGLWSINHRHNCPTYLDWVILSFL